MVRATVASEVTPRLSYVLPVHNQERVLRATVERLVKSLGAFPGSEVLLIENGSTDSSPELGCALAAEHVGGAVSVVAARSARGMGHAYRRGIDLAGGDTLVLTAADLPFGFTDLDAYLHQQPRPRLAIGSKAHRGSQTRIPLSRRVMSETFRLLRRAVLGLRVRDSQGTILIDAALARALASRLQCGDYLISTEIVSWAVRLGVTPVELPVTYAAAGGSTVSPWRDSLHMAAGLFALRRRLRGVEEMAA